jgi:hypothetical protein
MSQVDFWYVRFPDGRVLRAASTAVLRQELSARRIPLGSTVRRSPNDEWIRLEWTQEFADVVEELTASHRPDAGLTNAISAPTTSLPTNRSANAVADYSATVGSRLDPARLHLVGVRGYLDELLAALDSALVAKKLLVGLIAGLLLGALLMLERAAWFERENRWPAAAGALLAICLLVFEGLTALLTRLTYIELARLRPARWRDGFDGVERLTFRLVVSKLLVWGPVGGLLVLLRWLPYWLGPGAEEAWSKNQQVLAGSVLAGAMLLEALLWPVFVLWWLLPPLLVAEGCTVWSGLRQWLALLRQHWGQVFLYQALAVGLSVVVTAPFLLLIAPLFLPSFSPPEALQEAAQGTRHLLLGLACAPFLTYWITSNVFIYLNLRYGASRPR